MIFSFMFMNENILFKDLNTLQTIDQQLQEYIANFFENIFEGIIFIEIGGMILYANSSAANIVGYSKKELVGKSIYDFVAANCKKTVQNNIKKNIKNPTK